MTRRGSRKGRCGRRRGRFKSASGIKGESRCNVDADDMSAAARRGGDTSMVRDYHPSNTRQNP